VSPDPTWSRTVSPTTRAAGALLPVVDRASRASRVSEAWSPRRPRWRLSRAPRAPRPGRLSVLRAPCGPVAASVAWSHVGLRVRHGRTRLASGGRQRFACLAVRHGPALRSTVALRGSSCTSVAWSPHVDRAVSTATRAAYALYRRSATLRVPHGSASRGPPRGGHVVSTTTRAAGAPSRAVVSAPRALRTSCASVALVPRGTSRSSRPYAPRLRRSSVFRAPRGSGMASIAQHRSASRIKLHQRCLVPHVGPRASRASRLAAP